MSQKQIDILQRALNREKTARKQAEKILESKSGELYQLTQDLKNSNEQLEQLLDEKSSQLQGVFENINDAYIVMNIEGDVLKMNDAAIDLFGYNIDNEDLNVVKLIFRDDIEYAMTSYNSLIEKGAFTDYTARIFTKKKDIKWVHINASLIYDNKNNPIAAQGIVRDITEAKYSDELIKEQKAQLDIIVENAPFGIALTQLGKMIKTNTSFQNLLDYNEEELRDKTIKDVSFEEDFAESKVHVEKMDNGEIDNFVLNKRYKKKDGSFIWAKTNVNAVRNNEGAIKYQVALIEDVTSERERSLILEMINDLAKSILGKENIYEIAWEITHNIANYLDTDDCVIYLVDYNTNTLEQIAAFGNKIEENNKIVNKIILPIGEGIVGSVVKSGNAEIINDTSKDDRYLVDDKRRLSEITVPIISEGKVIGIIDSENSNKNYFRKEHLKTLKSIANLVAMQLKSAINIREREEAESQNSQLLVALGKSNDELQEYAHIVSHDLKSPLRSLSALTSWIRDDNKGKFDASSIQNFQLIETTLERMEQLISDILLYSSVGSEATENKEVDLHLLVEDLKEILFIPKHISVNVLSKLPVVIGDKTKFQQLFQNLISNAIKFNDKESGLIEIDVKEQKSFYQFSIKDNGIGIDKKYHDTVFKIFHSLNNNKESTGIGLSIVKKIIDLFKGNIWLESEVKIGTTFYFTLKKISNGTT